MCPFFSGQFNKVDSPNGGDSIFLSFGAPNPHLLIIPD